MSALCQSRARLGSTVSAALQLGDRQVVGQAQLVRQHAADVGVDGGESALWADEDGARRAGPTGRA
jgi:hypothetical protein